MRTVVVDQADYALWQDFAKRLEVRDEQGLLLGIFTPADEIARGYRTAEEGEVPFAPEELEALCKQAKTGRPLREILPDLEKLQ